VQTGPFGSQLHASDYVQFGIPSIMPKDIGQRLEVNLESIAYITEENAQRLQKYRVKRDDIVCSRRGDVEKCAFITAKMDGWLCGTGCLKVSFIARDVVPRFIAYYLSTDDSKHWLTNHAVGTTMPNLNSGTLGRFPILLPPLPEQQAIAAVLSSLDDKIDLLHRQNKTLEALAQTLFRHWFVDGAEDDWEEGIITDIFEIRDGTHDSPKQKNVGKPLITSKHINDFRLDFENAYLISDEDFAKINKRSNVETFDILFSMIGTVGLTHLEQSKMVDYAIKNVSVLKTSQNPKWAYYTYLWLNSSLGQEFIFENKSGSTQEYISLGSLRNITFVKPPEHVLENFNTIAVPLFNKIQTNQDQIRTLENLRDTLLPKLMSGEVRVRL